MNNAPANAGLLSDRRRSTKRRLPLVLLLCFIISTALGLYALSFLRGVLVSERGRDLSMNPAAVANTRDRVTFERFGDIRLFANDGVLRTAPRLKRPPGSWPSNNSSDITPGRESPMRTGNSRPPPTRYRCRGRKV